MTSSRSVNQSFSSVAAVVRSFPQLVLIRFVRGVALLILIGALGLGAFAVVRLLYSQTLPQTPAAPPEVVLSLDKLASIEQALAARRLAAQTGLILSGRNYFAQPAASP